MIANVVWRAASVSGEYFIRGKNFCPGDDCLHYKNSVLKAKFKELDYSYFMDE